MHTAALYSRYLFAHQLRIHACTQPFFSITQDAETVPVNPVTTVAQGTTLHVPIIMSSTAELAMNSFIYDGGEASSSTRFKLS